MTVSSHTLRSKDHEFLRDHLLPRFLWARLRLAFPKLWLFVTKVLALGEIHEIGGAISIIPQNIANLLEWPAPQDVSHVRGFLGTCQTVRRCVKSFAEIARPLQQLAGKVTWRWTESEELSFLLLRELCATKGQNVRVGP